MRWCCIIAVRGISKLLQRRKWKKNTQEKKQGRKKKRVVTGGSVIHIHSHLRLWPSFHVLLSSIKITDLSAECEKSMIMRTLWIKLGDLETAGPSGNLSSVQIVNVLQPTQRISLGLTLYGSLFSPNGFKREMRKYLWSRKIVYYRF